jgi:uncharacterized LabA/DUF88 family protein
VVETEAAAPAPLSTAARVRVFIDYWNFQLALNEVESRAQGQVSRFKVDWRGAGPWLARNAAQAIGLTAAACSFDGVIIYSSFNPQTQEGRGFHRWMTTWLARQPGVQVECRERKRKAPPKCPSCYRRIERCPHPDCQKDMLATEEKGVDTLIATDMIRLAWENAYDLAVLASSDSDLVPAVEFLRLKGRKVVQAGFPPLGVALATASWASFDVASRREELRRHEPSSAA